MLTVTKLDIHCQSVLSIVENLCDLRRRVQLLMAGDLRASQSLG